MRNGDRVRVKSTGDTAIYITERLWDQSWWGGKPNPPLWQGYIEYPNGDHDWQPLADLEPLERTKR